MKNRIRNVTASALLTIMMAGCGSIPTVLVCKPPVCVGIFSDELAPKIVSSLKKETENSSEEKE